MKVKVTFKIKNNPKVYTHIFEGFKSSEEMNLKLQEYKNNVLKNPIFKEGYEYFNILT